MRTLQPDDDCAADLLRAIRSGDLDRLARLLDEDRALAGAWVRDRRGLARSPLHVVTDWPGSFPGGRATVRLLADAGADPNAAIGGDGETPLHWAASSDDVDVADALIDAGAGLEARGESILAAVPPPSAEDIHNAFWQACHGGQRRAAELLLGRGADPSWVPDYAEGSVLEVAAGPGTRRDLLVTWLRGQIGPGER